MVDQQWHNQYDWLGKQKPENKGIMNPWYHWTYETQGSGSITPTKAVGINWDPL
jgi:hypothetical protein